MTRSAERVAWITGAGSGIGRATALRLAESGALTILTGRRKEPLEDVANLIRSRGGEAHILPADISDIEAIGAAADRIVASEGRLDIYVGAAGMNVQQRSFTTLSPETADLVLRSNLNGAFHASAAALKAMRRLRQGLLVHVSSWSGKRVSPWSGPAYTAAKAGLIALSESINLEVANEGIRSTVIIPGGVDTPLLDQLPRPLSPEARSALLQPEDCADLIAYIAALPPHIRIDEVVITPVSQTQ